MAVIGTTGALLIGAGLPVVGKAIGNRIRSKETDYDKYNQRQLAELERRQEMGTLGLSAEEERMLRDQFASPIIQTQREGEQRRRQLMASSDVGGGQALLQAGLADTAALEARGQAELAVAEADYKKEQAQRQELEDRMAQEARREMSIRERRAALVEQGVEAGGDFFARKRQIAGAKDPAVAKAVGNAYGITDPREQAQFAEFLSLNPEMAGSLTSSIKK